MDKKSILIGALGASLLFVTLGAGINQTEPAKLEWKPLEVLTKGERTELTSFTIHTFEVLYTGFDAESNEWKYKIEDESVMEEREE